MSPLHWAPIHPHHIPISQSQPPPQISPQQFFNLHADVKTVLGHLAASHDEQESIFKEVKDLRTNIKVLERLLGGNISSSENTDPDDLLNGCSSIMHRLMAMEGAINHLFAHLVSNLHSAPPPPAVHCNTSTSESPPAPSDHPCQKEYVDVSTSTLPPSACLYRPLFPSIHNPLLETLTPADWNAKPANGTTQPESTSSAPDPLLYKVSANEPDRFLSPFPTTPSRDAPCDESFSRANAINTVGTSFGSFSNSLSSLDSPDQQLLLTSPTFNPTSSSESNPAPSHHTPASPPHKSASGSTSSLVPILPTPPQSSSSSSSNDIAVISTSADLSLVYPDTPSSDSGSSPPSFEANVEASPPAREAVSEVPPSPAFGTQQSPHGRGGPSQAVDVYALGKLIFGRNLPLWPEVRDVEPYGPGPIPTPEFDDGNRVFRGEESRRLDRDAWLDEAKCEHPHKSGHADITELLRPDRLDLYGPLHGEDSREQTPLDSLFRDEEAVAAALAFTSLSPERTSPPTETSFGHLPLQPEIEAQDEYASVNVENQRKYTALEQQKEIYDYEDNNLASGSTLVEFDDFMNANTGPSALRSTYPEMHEEPEASVQPEHTFPGHTVTTSLHSRLSPFSSPLSSLGEDEIEEQNGTSVQLRKTERFNPKESFNGYKRRSGSSLSAMQKNMGPRKSGSTSLAFAGGPSASIEELAVLARKDPPKLNIKLSELKRKLQSLGSATEPPEKRTRLNAVIEMGDASLSTDDMNSVISGLTRDRDAGNLKNRYSHPSTSEQDVTGLQVENVSTLMDVDSASASGAGTINEPAQTFMTTSDMTSVEPSLSELRVNSTHPPDKQVQSQSCPPMEPITQKDCEPGRSKRGRLQKRKSQVQTYQDKPQSCQWPAKSYQDGSIQFVQCDNCDFWYHFGCVGLVEGDPRLEPDAAFICPPCCVSAAKRLTLRKRTETCARPDCSRTNLDAEEYIIERLVGRKPVGEAGFLFLVKWEGYSMAQASWIPEGSMVGASRTLNQFIVDAMAEGIDLETKGSTVLLMEAKDGGWEV